MIQHNRTMRLVWPRIHWQPTSGWRGRRTPCHRLRWSRLWRGLGPPQPRSRCVAQDLAMLCACKFQRHKCQATTCRRPTSHRSIWHAFFDPDKIATGCADTAWTEEANRRLWFQLADTPYMSSHTNPHWPTLHAPSGCLHLVPGEEKNCMQTGCSASLGNLSHILFASVHAVARLAKRAVLDWQNLHVANNDELCCVTLKWLRTIYFIESEG